MELSTTEEEVVSFRRQTQRKKGVFCVRGPNVFKVSCFHKVFSCCYVSCVCVCVCVSVCALAGTHTQFKGGFGIAEHKSATFFCCVKCALTHIFIYLTIKCHPPVFSPVASVRVAPNV